MAIQPEAVAVAEAGASRAKPSLRERLHRIEGKDAIALILSWKLGSLLVLFLSVGLFQPESRVLQDPKDFGEAYALFKTSLSNTWDTNHYIYLAEEGYKKDQFQNAFYPLYPMTMKALNFVTGDSLTSGLLIANVASGLGLYLFYLFVKRLSQRETAILALALFISFPTAFYLNIIYTEGPFLALLMGFFYLLYGRHYAAAAVVAFFLPLTRSVGIFAFVPFVAFIFIDAVQRAEVDKPLSRKTLAALIDSDWHYASAPIFGAVAYLGFMYLTTGDPASGFEAQGKFQSQVSLSNLFEPAQFLRNFFVSDIVIHNYGQSALDRLVFIGFLTTLPFVYRRVDKPLFLFCVLLGLLPLLGTFAGYLRYVMICFPVYIAFGSYFAERQGLFLASAIAPMLILQGLFTAMHVMTYWVA